MKNLKLKNSMDLLWSKFMKLDVIPYSWVIIKQIIGKGSILDVSGGNGRFLRFINHSEGFVSDISLFALKTVKEKIHPVQCDSHYLPFKMHSFEYSTCIDSLQFMSDVEMVIREMIRVSKEYIILALPNYFFWKMRLKHLFGRYYGREFFDTDQRIKLNCFDVKYNQRLLKKLNLEIIKFDVEGWFPFCKLLSGRLRNFISKKFPNLLGGMLIYSCKNGDIKRDAYEK